MNADTMRRLKAALESGQGAAQALYSGPANLAHDEKTEWRSKPPANLSAPPIPAPSGTLPGMDDVKAGLRRIEAGQADLLAAAKRPQSIPPPVPTQRRSATLDLSPTPAPRPQPAPIPPTSSPQLRPPTRS